MSLPAGHASELFFCQQAGRTDDFISPYVLLADLRISEFGKLVPVLEGFAKKDKSIVIFCRGIEGPALAALALNIRDAGLKATAIAIPDVSFRTLDILGDIQVVSDGTIVSDTLGQGLDSLRPDMLGRLSRVEVFANRCVLWGEASDSSLVTARAAEIRQEIKKNKYLSLDKERAELRLAHLIGSIAEMHVGKLSLSGQEQSLQVTERITRALLNARTGGRSAWCRVFRFCTLLNAAPPLEPWGEKFFPERLERQDWQSTASRMSNIFERFVENILCIKRRLKVVWTAR